MDENLKKRIGKPAALARLLAGDPRAEPITPQAISQWQRVPAERVLEVERATGVPRHELRPDLYPSEEGQAA